jgi:tRNA pseudouridine55 synthase
MYSALKRAGQPLYKLARAGVTVARAARDIELFELALLALGPASLELEALCSKGTYIRVLAEDLAGALGTCGHVTALRRLYVEPFESEPMHTLESLAETCARGAWPRLLASDWPLGHLTAVRLVRSEAQRLLSGQSVMAEVAGAPAAVRLYDETGTFLGLGEADGHGAVRPRRLLNPAP